MGWNSEHALCVMSVLNRICAHVVQYHEMAATGALDSPIVIGDVDSDDKKGMPTAREDTDDKG